MEVVLVQPQRWRFLLVILINPYGPKVLSPVLPYNNLSQWHPNDVSSSLVGMSPSPCEVYPFKFNQNINQNLQKNPCHPISEDPLPGMSKTQTPFSQNWMGFVGRNAKKKSGLKHLPVVRLISAERLRMGCNGSFMIQVWWAVSAQFAGYSNVSFGRCAVPNWHQPSYLVLEVHLR